MNKLINQSLALLLVQHLILRLLDKYRVNIPVVYNVKEEMEYKDCLAKIRGSQYREDIFTRISHYCVVYMLYLTIQVDWLVSAFTSFLVLIFVLTNFHLLK